MNKTGKKNRIDLCLSDRIMQAIVYALMLLLILIILYPLIYVVSSSFSSGEAVSTGKVLL